MKICKDGHINQAGGCCCPTCGNTCGFHPEYFGYSGEYIKQAPLSSNFTISSLEDLAKKSPEWRKRLKVANVISN